MRVGAHPVINPPFPLNTPNSELIFDKPSPKDLYKVGSTYLLHLTTSKGVMAA